MKLDTPIAPVMFSSELDRIKISGLSPGQKWNLRIDDYDYRVAMLDLTLYANSSGVIELSNMTPVLNDLVNHEAMNIALPGLTEGIFLIPANVSNSLPAMSYLDRLPLGNATGTRTAWKGRHLYMAVALSPGTDWKLTLEVDCSAPFSVVKPIPDVKDPVSLIVMTADPAAEMEKRGIDDSNFMCRLSVTDTKGHRIVQEYDVQSCPSGGLSMPFLTSAGFIDELPFSKVTKSCKAKRETTRIDGVLTPYSIEDDSTYEGVTPPLHDGEAAVAEDFIRSPGLFAPDAAKSGRRPYVVTGGELKNNSEAAAMVRATATWKEAALMPHVVKPAFRIFDMSFDNSFA